MNLLAALEEVVDTNQDGVADTVCIPYGTMVDMIETILFWHNTCGGAPAPWTWHD